VERRHYTRVNPASAALAASILLGSVAACSSSAKTVAPAAVNPDPAARSASVTVGSRQVPLTQQAAACRYQLLVGAANLPAGGGTAAIEVAASSGLCEWQARSEVDWIAIKEGATGRGSGRVLVEAGPSSSPTRAGALVIADQRVTVTQGDGCGFAISPGSQSVGASGGSGTVSVTTGLRCPWTAASQAGWITITSGASGAGRGSVAFNVSATDGPTRTGTLLVAGHSFRVTRSPGCAFSIDAPTATIPSSGGTGEVRVATAAGCAWTAASHAAWITVTAGASGNGPGSVRFSVPAHGGPTRTGTMTVAGRTFTVTQQSGCTAALAAGSASFAAGGGAGGVAVSAPAGCPWTAASDPATAWVRITAGAGGTGDGRVDFVVDSNSGPARSAALAIAGLPFTVHQSSGCTYTISPASQAMGSAGATGSVAVTTSGSCTWSATSALQWISITAGASGTGSGNVLFSVAANAGPARTGTLSVAGQTFTVEQASGCAFTIAPTAQSFEVVGGSGTIAVTTGDGCAWTASSPVEWVTITTGATGTGSGSVTFLVTPDTGAARSATLTVAGQTFTVTQAGT
jgi:hypothetical protein